MNPLTFVPADLDYVDVPAYRFATDAVFKNASIRKNGPLPGVVGTRLPPVKTLRPTAPRRCPPRHAATPETHLER